MKKLRKIFNIFYIFILTFSFILSPLPVFANDTAKVGRINSDSLNVRSGPGTDYPVIATFYLGTSFEVLGVASSGAGCEAPWLSIRYNINDRGYVCSEFVDQWDITLGDMDPAFPESYRYQLAFLKGMHPNWTFTPLNTGLDWSYVIDQEDALGKSLLWCSNNPTENNYDGWTSSTKGQKP
jgi:hypothetical protein